MTEEVRAAYISDDGLYRYDLVRRWGIGVDPIVLWVLCNPSTADANTDDPTIRKCRGFTNQWGLAGFVVVNLYAYRSPKSRDLTDLADPVGPENADVIRRWLRYSRVGLVMAAWGDSWLHTGHPRFNVERWAEDEGHGVQCLGRTKRRQPRHPARLAYDTSPAGFVASRDRPIVMHP